MIPELRYRNYIVCDYISGSHSIGVNLLNLPSWATESTDNIGVFGTFGRKTLAIMFICIGDGIRESLFNNQFVIVLVIKKLILRL